MVDFLDLTEMTRDIETHTGAPKLVYSTALNDIQIFSRDSIENPGGSALSRTHVCMYIRCKNRARKSEGDNRKKRGEERARRSVCKTDGKK